MKNLFKKESAADEVVVGKMDLLINSVRSGRLQSRNEWALEIFAGLSLADAQGRMGSLVSSIKKSRSIFLAPESQGGNLIEIDQSNDNHAAIISSRKRATSTMKNHVAACEKSVLINPKDKTFYNKEAAAGIFVSLGQYLGETGMDLTKLTEGNIKGLIAKK